MSTMQVGQQHSGADASTHMADEDCPGAGGVWLLQLDCNMDTRRQQGGRPNVECNVRHACF